MNFFLGEKNLTDYAEYPLMGYEVGCFGMVGYHLSSTCQDSKLAQIIVNSTQSSELKDKNLGHLAKLTLSLKKDESFMRLSEIQEETFGDIMSINLQLNRKGHKLLPYPPNEVEDPNQILWLSYSQSISLPYDFYTSIAKIRIDEDDYECKYIRYLLNKKNKMFTIHSSVYSAHMHILPTKNNKYKIFVLDSEQYDNLKNPIPLDIYIRVLIANVDKHNIAEYESVWIPQLKG